MSLPYCLTNPKLRLVPTKWGLATLERLAPQDYAVFVEGVRMGRVTKFKSWFANDDATAYKTRHAAIDAAIVGWYQRAKATGATS